MGSININCRKNDSGYWCKDKRIKRSLLGIGARMCLVAEGKECKYQDKYPRPNPPVGCGSKFVDITKKKVIVSLMEF